MCPGVCITRTDTRPTSNDPAVTQRVRARLGRVAVAPLLAAFAREQQPRARALGQLARAGDEVGVDVGLGHVGDAQALGLRGAQVGLDVTVGIHHQRLAGGLAPEEVAGLRELVVVEASKEHGVSRVGGRQQRAQRQAGASHARRGRRGAARA